MTDSLSVLKERILQQIKKEIPSETAVHGLDHTFRVLQNCLNIGPKEKADLEVLMAAALLHDVGRELGYSGMKHAEKGAVIAKKILRETAFPEDKIGKVMEAIRTHDDDVLLSERKSIESKILFDADKMEAFGIIGISRALMEFGRKGRTLQDVAKWWRNGLKKRFDGVFTETAKKIIAKDYEISRKFFEELERKINNIE